MAAIKKLATNRYQLVFIIFGHRIRTNFHREAHAVDFRKRLFEVLPDYPYTIAQSINAYLRNESDKRKIKQTRIMERYWFYELREFLKRKGLPSDSMMAQVKQFHLIEFQTELVEKGSARGRRLSHASVNRRFNTIKNFFNRLHEWGFIRTNPAEHIRRLPEDANARAVWSDKDISMALYSGNLPILLRDLFLFLLYTGVRLGSACGVQVRDVNIESNSLAIRQRKGDGTENVYVIPISSKISDIIRVRMTKNPADFLFRDHRGKKLYAGWYSKRFTRAFSRVDLKNVTLHGLRHTFASKLSAAGASTETIRRLLGHKSVKTTQKYTQLDLDQLRSWVD